MFVAERRNIILDLLKQKKRIEVKEVAAQIGISEATLRTDLKQLEADGLLTRTHGGAVLNEEKETSFSERKKKNIKEKSYIATEAFKLIEEKQCIVLDASSTALELARYLSNQSIKLTVITSGLQTAMELKENPNITLVLIGGVATKGSSAIEGTFGLGILDHFNIDTMYTSGSGFTFTNGITDFNLYEVKLKAEMVKRANKVVALIDSSKMGKTSSSVFASLDQIDTLITDKKLEDELRDKLESKDIKVIVAN